MKNRNKFLISVMLLVNAITGCRDFDYSEIIPTTVPVIENISFNPSTGLQYGDSVTISASLSDKIQLSTLEVSIEINSEIVSSSVFRTKGTTVTWNGKMYIPLIKGVNDGPVRFRFTLTNVQGGTSSEEQEVNVVRPDFNELYLRFADGTTLLMSPDPSMPYVYVTDSASFSTSLLAKVLSHTDYSGFTWVKGEEEIVLGDEFSPFISLNDPTIIPYRVAFDAFNFRLFFIGEQLPSVKIAGVTMLPGSDGLFHGSILLSKNQILSFEGINNPIGALDPDFFTLSGQDVLFTAESGTYAIAYDPLKNFILVELENASFPDALWVTGTGMGKPTGAAQTTSGWGWDNPYQYFFCKRTGEKTFEITLYLSDGNFKFFKEKGWGGGEFRLDTGFDYISPGFVTNSDGNYVQTGEPGVYHLIIELDNEGSYRFMAQKID